MLSMEFRLWLVKVLPLLLLPLLLPLLLLLIVRCTPRDNVDDSTLERSSSDPCCCNGIIRSVTTLDL